MNSKNVENTWKIRGKYVENNLKTGGK